MRGEVGQAYDEARAEVASEVAADALPDTCRVLVGGTEHKNIPCKLKGGSGNVDGAPYRIRFAWGSPAVVGAAVVVDAIEGRPELTLQIVAPTDSSTAIWQEWQATSAPIYGRANVGL